MSLEPVLRLKPLATTQRNLFSNNCWIGRYGNVSYFWWQTDTNTRQKHGCVNLNVWKRTRETWNPPCQKKMCRRGSSVFRRSFHVLLIVFMREQMFHALGQWCYFEHWIMTVFTVWKLHVLSLRRTQLSIVSSGSRSHCLQVVVSILPRMVSFLLFIWVFPKIGVKTPNHPFGNSGFPLFSPSILGEISPYFWFNTHIFLTVSSQCHLRWMTCLTQRCVPIFLPVLNYTPEEDGSWSWSETVLKRNKWN